MKINLPSRAQTVTAVALMSLSGCDTTPTETPECPQVPAASERPSEAELAKLRSASQALMDGALPCGIEYSNAKLSYTNLEDSVMALCGNPEVETLQNDLGDQIRAICTVHAERHGHIDLLLDNQPQLCVTAARAKSCFDQVDAAREIVANMK